MNDSSRRHWLALAGTGVVFAAVLGLVALQSAEPGAREEAEIKDARALAQKAQPPQGRNWPMFGGTNARNLVNLIDRNVPTDWSIDDKKPRNVKWSVELGSKAYGGPVFSGGKIFIGTNNDAPRDPKITGDKGIVMCFNEADGKFLWQAIHDKLPGGRVNDWPEEGICSSPVVEGNRLYYVNNRCQVICATTGGLAAGNEGVQDEEYKGPDKADIVWRLDMIRELKVFPHNLATCSPLLVGDTLFVITSNGVDERHINIPQPQAPSFLAINKNTGKVIWSSNLPSVNLIAARAKNPNITLKEMVDKGLVLMHGQWSNPVYAEVKGQPQIIFPGGDGWMYGFDPAGDGKGGAKLLWKFDCNPKVSRYELGGTGTRSDFVCTPVVWEDKLYIGTGQDPEHKRGVGHLWCIDIAKKPNNPDLDLSPKKEDDKLQTFDPKDPANKDSGLVWHYGGFNPPGAARPWKYGRTLSTVAVHDGLVYAAEYEGYLHCLDARTGQEYWQHRLGADTWGSPYWVDGKVYLGCEGGAVFIFEHGKEKKLLKKVDMGDCQIRATPVVNNGVLYVMPENECRLYAIK
jgi:outer membrane protein assembly factor BamB